MKPGTTKPATIPMAGPRPRNEDASTTSGPDRPGDGGPEAGRSGGVRPCCCATPRSVPRDQLRRWRRGPDVLRRPSGEYATEGNFVCQRPRLRDQSTHPGGQIYGVDGRRRGAVQRRPEGHIPHRVADRRDSEGRPSSYGPSPPGHQHQRRPDHPAHPWPSRGTRSGRTGPAPLTGSGPQTAQNGWVMRATFPCVSGPLSDAGPGGIRRSRAAGREPRLGSPRPSCPE